MEANAKILQGESSIIENLKELEMFLCISLSSLSLSPLPSVYVFKDPS
jgi:hypothetical protein